MIEFLEHIDRQIVLTINGFNSPFLDNFMIFATGDTSWLPLYAVMIAWMYFEFKNFKKTLLFTFIIILSVALADFISVKLFKEVFERYRPCHNELLKPLLHLPNGCGGKFGFVSSHACNTAGYLTWVVLLYKNKPLKAAIFLWVIVVSYSRIYLGAHYLSDIIGGWAVGAGFCFGVYKALEYFGFYSSQPSQTSSS